MKKTIKIKRFLVLALIVLTQMCCSAVFAQFGHEEYVDDSNLHIIKVNLTKALIADFTPSYAIYINRSIGAEIGLGVTYLSYVGDMLYNEAVQNEGLTTAYQAKLGISYFLNMKYFFSQQEFGGFYMGLEYMSRKRNAFHAATSTTPAGDISRKYVTTMLTLGTVKEWRNALFFDIYGGIGYGTTSGNNWRYTATFESENRTYSNALPMASIHIKLGYRL